LPMCDCRLRKQSHLAGEGRGGRGEQPRGCSGALVPSHLPSAGGPSEFSHNSQPTRRMAPGGEWAPGCDFGALEARPRLLAPGFYFRPGGGPAGTHPRGVGGIPPRGGGPGETKKKTQLFPPPQGGTQGGWDVPHTFGNICTDDMFAKSCVVKMVA